MKIEFDPRDRDACASVLAMIDALHPDVPATVAAQFDPTPNAEVTDDEPDAAAAFGAAGNAPADSGTATEPARAGTPAAGTPAASSSGPAAPPIASPSSDVELDADGLPWDARIHSGPEDKRPKTADGKWRKKRGVSDEETERVRAELRQIMGAPAPSPTPAAAAPAPTPPPPPVAAAEPAAAPTTAPPAPPPTPPVADMASGADAATTAASPPAPPTAAAPAKTFAELMKKVTARQTAGTLTVTDTKATAEALGLTGIADLLKRPDLIEAFEQALPGESA